MSILKKLLRFAFQKISLISCGKSFDDLEFPKAETFAKMTEKRERRESFCP